MTQHRESEKKVNNMGDENTSESDRVRDNRGLTEAFATAGAKHGFDDVSAGFSAFKNFKVKWARNQKWAEFQVTDYLYDAPSGVVQDIADVIFRKIRGEEAGYSAETVAYLSSDGFFDGKRGTYLGRLNGFTTEYTGEKHPLVESVRRLAEKGLIEEDPKLVIGWFGPVGLRTAVGGVSTLMHVVGVNAGLAGDDVDEELLDFAVFNLLVSLHAGFPSTAGDMARERERAVAGYPDGAALTGRLIDAGFHLSVQSL